MHNLVDDQLAGGQLAGGQLAGGQLAGGQLAGGRRWRAPRGHGESLVAPDWDAAVEMLDRNSIALQAASGVTLLGRPLGTLAASARTELICSALAYTRRYRDVESPPTDRILLAGHQPELFHAGVWFKNLALDYLASRCGAAAINLVVDNDLCRQPGIRVPTGSLVAPRVEVVPFDRTASIVAFEERRVQDGKAFATFAERVAGVLQPLLAKPLVAKLWPWAVERWRAGEPLGACVAQARHRLEADWGWRTLELPVSSLCRFEAFHWLVAFLLAELPRLHAEYNAALCEHRRTRRVRSVAHPVPNLAGDGGWFELPLWMWRSADPTRRRIFARTGPQGVVITDRAGFAAEIPIHLHARPEPAVEQLAALESKGVKLRPRALITTLFARLFLGDLFLHGIGGAKYDELTDELVRRWFGCQPPGFMVVSATCRLPIERPAIAGNDDVRQWTRRLRELTYQPERYVDVESLSDSQRMRAIDAMNAKRRWIFDRVDERGRPASPAERHRGIVAANVALQPFVADHRATWNAAREAAESVQRAEAILSSREYSFCLFPEESLRRLLLGMLPPRSYIPPG